MDEAISVPGGAILSSLSYGYVSAGGGGDLDNSGGDRHRPWFCCPAIY